MKACLIGRSLTLVESDGLGVAMNLAEEGCQATVAQPMHGLRLRDLAEHAKSWNMADAALGTAAINAFHNTPERLSLWDNRDLEDKIAMALTRAEVGEHTPQI